MTARSKIEWTDRTWNPVTGCTKVSPGCDHCYAETMARRFAGGAAFPRGFEVSLRPDRLVEPLRWRKPSRVFVNSMSDLFHSDIEDDFIADVFAVMSAGHHTYQVLTKRHGRMRSLLSSEAFRDNVDSRRNQAGRWQIPGSLQWPLPNVWLGVSVEDQQRADVRIPALLNTPAALRFISAEPLLGPVSLYTPYDGFPIHGGGLDWVIVGGESGASARPMDPAWARTLRDQCVAAAIPFFFKQWGEYLPATVFDAPDFVGGRAYREPGGGTTAAALRERGSASFRTGVTRAMRPGDANGHGVMLTTDTIALRVGKKRAGRELDGRTWDEYPPGESP